MKTNRNAKGIQKIGTAPKRRYPKHPTYIIKMKINVILTTCLAKSKWYPMRLIAGLKAHVGN